MNRETLQLIQKINDKLQLVTDEDLHYNDKRFVVHCRCVQNFTWFESKLNNDDFFEFEFRNHLLEIFIMKLNKWITKNRSEILTNSVFKDIIELNKIVDKVTDDYFEYKLRMIIPLHHRDREELEYISKN